MLMHFVGSEDKHFEIEQCQESDLFLAIPHINSYLLKEYQTEYYFLERQWELHVKWTSG